MLPARRALWSRPRPSSLVTPPPPPCRPGLPRAAQSLGTQGLGDKSLAVEERQVAASPSSTGSVLGSREVR